MTASTVPNGVSGSATAHWMLTDRLACGECGHTWTDRSTYLEWLTCPRCDARVRRNGAPESTVTLEVLHQWTPQDFGLGPLKNVASSLSITFAMRAPIYFWDEMAKYPHGCGLLSNRLPLTESNFAVSPGPLTLARLNAAHDTHDSAALLALTPTGLYRTGTLVVAYYTLNRMAQDNRFNPLYEWQKFLALVKAEVQLLELCPALEAIRADADL